MFNTELEELVDGLIGMLLPLNPPELVVDDPEEGDPEDSEARDAELLLSEIELWDEAEEVNELEELSTSSSRHLRVAYLPFTAHHTSLVPVADCTDVCDLNGWVALPLMRSWYVVSFSRHRTMLFEVFVSVDIWVSVGMAMKSCATTHATPLENVIA